MSAPDRAPAVTLRPVLPADDAFLFQVYVSSRPDDLATLLTEPVQREMLLRMQYNAQQLSYSAQYPEADHQIILLAGQPVGRVIVNRAAQEMVGVDIALLPEQRRSGVGTYLIKELLAEAGARGVPFRLQVLKANPARHLYHRLGFKLTGEDAVNFAMEWRPDHTG